MKHKKERKVKTQTKNVKHNSLTKGVILPIISLFFFLFLFSFNLSAAPPITNVQIFQADEKISIIYPKSGIQEQNQGFLINYYTLNKNNSKLMIEEDIDYCILTLMNDKGKITYYKNSTFNSSNNYWQNNINKSYFKNTGIYRFDIFCQNGQIDGAVSGVYEVTNNKNQDLVNILFFISIALGILIYAFSYSRDDSGHTILISGGFFIISGLISINYMGAFFESNLTNMAGYLLIGIGLIVLGDAIWRLFPDK